MPDVPVIVVQVVHTSVVPVVLEGAVGVQVAVPVVLLSVLLLVRLVVLDVVGAAGKLVQTFVVQVVPQIALLLVKQVAQLVAIQHVSCHAQQVVARVVM